MFTKNDKTTHTKNDTTSTSTSTSGDDDKSKLKNYQESSSYKASSCIQIFTTILYTFRVKYRNWKVLT